MADVPSSAYPDLGKPGGPGLFHHKGLKLPSYIERIAKHLHYEKGHPKGEAIAIAINVVKRMCATGDLNYPGIQHVAPPHQAAACAAVAEWERDKATPKK